jgi:hypothetical protein
MLALSTRTSLAFATSFIMRANLLAVPQTVEPGFMNSSKRRSQVNRRDLLKTGSVVILMTAFGSVPLLAAQGAAALPVHSQSEAGMVAMDQQKLRVQVYPARCSWSAELNDTEVSLGEVHFLSDTAGWTITHQVRENDLPQLGGFTTVTLHGVKPGEMDFDYHISVSKTGNDIIVSLDRLNNTGGTVKLGDMDYVVAPKARLEDGPAKWVALGVKSLYYAYYSLGPVADFGPGPDSNRNIYEVAQLVRHSDNDHAILMGHLTVNKGQSRFETIRTSAPDSMSLRAYCTYNVTVPPGKGFAGEKLLIHMGPDALLGMEHLGDLIGLANDIRLKQRRPIDLEDVDAVSCSHCRWMGWKAGQKDPKVVLKAMRDQGLDKFYYSAPQMRPDAGGSGKWALYYSGGSGEFSAGTDFPPECYLKVKVPWGNGMVLDFSRPETAQLERERIARIFEGKYKLVNWGHLDFAHGWNKWEQQYDQTMSAPETWHAGAAPWRDFVDQFSPRSRNRSCMTKLDLSYDYVDIARTSEDADWAYAPPDQKFCTFTRESVVGSAMRFFYNGRVYWNDADGFHVYRYENGEFSYGEGKVSATFHCLAASTAYVSEKFDQAYPEERLELLRRIAPPTMDTGYPVDLFVRKPAQVWNMPIVRPFGRWCVLGVFNYGDGTREPFTAKLDAQRDLRLDPEKEYLVYEFWTKTFLGSFKKTFTSRTIQPRDCDVYCIVEKLDRPVLLSTSRHVRQMAMDIKDLSWDAATKTLKSVSRAVSGDPYQLRVYMPESYRLDRVVLPSGLTATTHTENGLLLVNYTTADSNDVNWSLHFR